MDGQPQPNLNNWRKTATAKITRKRLMHKLTVAKVNFDGLDSRVKYQTPIRVQKVR